MILLAAARVSVVNQDGSEVASRWLLARRYARTWLIIDLLAVVPDLLVLFYELNGCPLGQDCDLRLLSGLQCVSPHPLLALAQSAPALSEDRDRAKRPPIVTEDSTFRVHSCALTAVGPTQPCL